MIWDSLKYFTKNEKWGDPDKMNPALLLLLDRLRETIGKPFVIHCGYESDGHSTASQHYKGNAVDFHIEGLPLTEANRLLLAALHTIQIAGRQAHEVCGLGIYPDWNNPGFHLDVRGYSARWGAVKKEGKQVYISYNEALKKVA